MSDDDQELGGVLPAGLTGAGPPHPDGAAAAADPRHTDAPQHAPGEQHGGAPNQAPGPQHANGAGPGTTPDHLADPRQASGPQHAASPQQAPAPQHASSPTDAPAAQHAGGATDGPTAQHAASQQIGGPQHEGTAPQARGPQHDATGPEAPGPQHAAPPPPAAASPGGGLFTKLRHLRHTRPAMHMLVVGGVAAAVVTVAGVAIYQVQADDPPAHQGLTTDTIEVATTSDPGAPVVTTVAGGATGATVASPASLPETTEPATTVAETTTTTPALVSYAGSYVVAVTDIILNGSPPDPGGDPQDWVLAGPCDGVGACALTNGAAEVPDTGTSPFSGYADPIQFVADGSGGYTSEFPFEFAECGNGTNTMTLRLTDGAISGTLGYTLNGVAGGCPPTTSTATFTGTRAG